MLTAETVLVILVMILALFMVSVILRVIYLERQVIAYRKAVEELVKLTDEGFKSVSSILSKIGGE